MIDKTDDHIFHTAPWKGSGTYTEEIVKNLYGGDLDSMELQPIKLYLTSLKELGAKWPVEIAKHISNNP